MGQILVFVLEAHDHPLPGPGAHCAAEFAPGLLRGPQPMHVLGPAWEYGWKAHARWDDLELNLRWWQDKRTRQHNDGYSPAGVRASPVCIMSHTASAVIVA